MSYYEDAKKELGLIEGSELGMDFPAQTEHVALAQLKATLALVDQVRALSNLQKEANEQAKIANLIALAGLEGHLYLSRVALARLSAVVPGQGITSSHVGLDPEVAKALGIKAEDL